MDEGNDRMVVSRLQENRCAVVANGEDLPGQIDALEQELRSTYVRLDSVMCALESLLQSPAMTAQLRCTLADAIIPAASALSSGAARMRSRMQQLERRTSVCWP